MCLRASTVSSAFAAIYSSFKLLVFPLLSLESGLMLAEVKDVAELRFAFKIPMFSWLDYMEVTVMPGASFLLWSTVIPTRQSILDSRVM